MYFLFQTSHDNEIETSKQKIARILGLKNCMLINLTVLLNFKTRCNIFLFIFHIMYLIIATFARCNNQKNCQTIFQNVAFYQQPMIENSDYNLNEHIWVTKNMLLVKIRRCERIDIKNTKQVFEFIDLCQGLSFVRAQSQSELSMMLTINFE